jgi:hypothetical protein
MRIRSATISTIIFYNALASHANEPKGVVVVFFHPHVWHFEVCLCQTDADFFTKRI